MSTTSPGGNDAANCKAVACDFSSSPCGYTPQGGNGGGTGWATSSQRVGNPDTGVFPEGTVVPFMATTVGPMQKAILQSGTLNITQTRVLKFKYWEDTDKMVLKACTNDESGTCWQSDPGTSIKDRKWLSSNLTLPAGTTKVVFVGQNNQGNYYGAAGIDEVQLWSVDPNDPTKLVKNVC